MVMSEVVCPDVGSLQCVLHGFAEDVDLETDYKEQIQAYAIKLSLMDDESAKVISWNKTMSQYYQSGDYSSAIKYLVDMKKSNVKYDDVTFIVALSNVVPLDDLKLGKLIHGLALKSGFGIKVNFSSSLDTDIVSWNSIINSYVQSGLVEESVNLYIEMLRDGLKPDQFTLASVLRACSSLSRGLHLTDQVHAHVVKNRLDSDTFVSTTLVDSYSRRGRMEQAESLFLNKNEFDFGSWNAMMFGYINSGNSHKAWEVFTVMHKNCEKPDEVTLATMAKACAYLVDMYIKCGDMVDAYQIFQAIPSPDDVVWTSMILGCVENGDEDRALVIYHKMRQSGVLPDEYTIATLIKACSCSTALEQGRQIHANAIKSNYVLDTYVSTSLID
nr:pentatricopeptide repeat-containing protein At4g33170 [Tanacetum cinerariifolium]